MMILVFKLNKKYLVIIDEAQNEHPLTSPVAVNEFTSVGTVKSTLVKSTLVESVSRVRDLIAPVAADQGTLVGIVESTSVENMPVDGTSAVRDHEERTSPVTANEGT
jgi:hypothetical protein